MDKDFIELQYLRGKLSALQRALYLISKHDPQTGYEPNPAYWGRTLREELCAEVVELSAKIKELEKRERRRKKNV